MEITQAPHLQLSPKVAQRIADRTAEQPRAITVRLVGRKDVHKLVSGIKQAQKASLKMRMPLD